MPTTQRKKHAILNNSLIALTFVISVFFGSQALAQQENKTDAGANNNVKEQTTAGNKAAEKSEQAKVATKEKAPESSDVGDSNLVPPADMLQQHQEDLKHYLKSSEVKPILVGLDSHTILERKNTTKNTKGTAILLPDWQQGATSPNAMNQLHQALPNKGWNTITIQPLSAPSNFPSQALKAVQQNEENQASLETYEKKLVPILSKIMERAQSAPGVLMVISQGNHGAILVNLYQKHPDLQPLVYVMLSSYLPTETSQMFTAKNLAELEIPVLDLYLTRDHPYVKPSAALRAQYANQSFKVDYRQKELHSVTPSYYPTATLLRELQGWLRSLGW